MENEAGKAAVNPVLDDNIRFLEDTFDGCGDYIGRKFPAGGTIWLYMAYLDSMTNRDLMDLSIMERLFEMDMDSLSAKEPGGYFACLMNRGLPTADLKESEDMDAILTDILAGDTALFVDGYDKVVVISSKGFPGRGVTAAQTEVVVQGSKESFSEGLRTNTALIRRRIRDVNLKVKQTRAGRRSQTDIAFMYMEDIVRQSVLEETEARIAAIDIDALMDSGCVEQLIEESWLSPFPQAQLTERPDKAASAILEGRIAVIVDNSPFALIVPATLNCLFQSSEDYYNRWQIMSLTRLLRFAAAFMAVALPGLYIAIAVYHPSMIPLLLAAKMSAASHSVPFPALLEVLLMDAAFELLREAGVRLPGAMGGTIGIVGGLIIGQAAVEAGIVSPIVVIVVALTGVAAFSIPHVSLVYGFRLVKYLILILSGLLGFLGFWAGLLITLVHLAALTSFGIPYLMPFAAGEMNRYADVKDSLFRMPLFTLKKRPFFAKESQRIKQRGGSHAIR
jgi:spore germination protein